MSETTEIWKEIEFKGSGIFVSSNGQVKSNRILANRYSKGKCDYLYKIKITKKGYASVHISLNGNSKYMVVHRLVAKAFIANSENKPCVNHKNGIKTDNRVGNLEWCTSLENNHHALKMGLIPKRKINFTYILPLKISHIQVDEIKQLYLNGSISQYKIAKIYNISQSHISRILNRKVRLLKY